MWTQLVYSTVAAVSTNLAIDVTQLTNAPNPYIRFGDAVAIYEAVQERIAAALASERFFYKETKVLSHVVTEIGSYNPYEGWLTNTYYTATGQTFKAWNFSICDPYFNSEYWSYTNLTWANPPVQDWRLSRYLLNRAVSNLTAQFINRGFGEPVFTPISKFARTETNGIALEMYTPETLWTDAGSTSGAPHFAHAGSTGSLWVLRRALGLLNKTAIIPAVASTETASWQTNDESTAYVVTNDAAPDWYANATLLPAGEFRNPTVTPKNADPALTVTNGIIGETVSVYGPDRVVLYDNPDTNVWSATPLMVASPIHKNAYSHTVTHSATGAFSIAELGPGVSCTGVVSCVLTGYCVFNGTVTQGLFSATVTAPFSISHAGPSTNWAGAASWTNAPRLSDYFDVTDLTGTGAWSTAVIDGPFYRYGQASPRASVVVTMAPIWQTSVVWWAFTRCPP